ncbi:phosphotransferase [Actinoplanes derwentensis]|uniref:Phosphotransferase enzyme family protein n=1 Tax=Actinoplanes derwentensis TaxID=113562 RepID=A0A1H2AXW5_9ACTN|nr:phosphotransferase [Actinoplanes derwentensis]GID87246.1 hypothetical protein Ade03nite_61700 [Actinoplanes derwentensis]SDT50783.1 Phosphotransferase enzyme family protein [Actinoplanes derwentensis]
MDLIGFGREADVYALDSNRVLRRYRRGDDASGEAELMVHLYGIGYPVPRVHEVSGADLVLERLDGVTMTEAFGAGGAGGDGVGAGAAILADLHRRLHALPARVGQRAGDRILHRDLHPDNVMITSRGPVVIDWHNAAEGPPAVDVWLTAIILAQVAAEPGHQHAVAAAAFLRAFLSESGVTLFSEGGAAFLPEAGVALLSEGGVAFLPEVGAALMSEDGIALRPEGGDPVAAFDEAVAIRRADPALTAEEAAGLVATVGPLIRAALSGGR